LKLRLTMSGEVWKGCWRDIGDFGWRNI